jgi:CRP-like cAMP-binding protein
MSNKNVSQLLKDHPIFASVSEARLDCISKDPRCFTVSTKAGDDILDDEHYAPALGLIISGTVLVYRKGGGLPVLLQRLEGGQLFGVSTLFSRTNAYVTELRAGNDCRVFFVPVTIIKELISESSEFAGDYITFLSGKIRFLNERIAELSAPTIIQKVAVFLLRGDGRIAPNKVQLASALGIGRASLYRALDEISEMGLISLQGKSVVILDREGLLKLV